MSKMAENLFIKCPECNGEGNCVYERAVPMSNSNPYGYLEDYVAECDNCHGTGEIESDQYDQLGD
tara:strand:- start:6137 stop:6331 length:195 start_codon:yes stop_codon:yes gene_type:complete